MKLFKCFIAGKNFPGELINENELIGFYTTRYIEANTIDEAQLIALESIRNEERLKLPEGVKPSKNATVYFEKIEEVSPDDTPEIDLGFSFYIMGT